MQITAAAPAISPADDGLRGGYRPEQNERADAKEAENVDHPNDANFRASADVAYADPIVSAEELAALLQELPSLAPGALVERGR